jgi:hypothetical protein
MLRLGAKKSLPILELKDQNMENGKQSDSSGRIDWLSRLVAAAGALVGGGLVMLVLNLADVNLFPLGLIAYLAGISIGIILARFAATWLLRRPSDK